LGAFLELETRRKMPHLLSAALRTVLMDPTRKKYGGLKIKKIMPQHVDMTVKFVKNTSRACNTVLTEIST
jgi:hypothetical protein